jgi:hypothetical protein
MGFTLQDIDNYFKTGKLKAFWTCKKCNKENYLTETNLNENVEDLLKRVKASYT